MLEIKPRLIEESMNISNQHISMDAPLYEDDDNNLYDVILDNDSPG